MICLDYSFFFISNRFISKQASDSKLLSNFQDFSLRSNENYTLKKRGVFKISVKPTTHHDSAIPKALLGNL